MLAWYAFNNRASNPYNWLLYSNLEKAGVTVEEFSPWKVLAKRYDILHLHWPEAWLRTFFPGWLVKPPALIGLLDVARAKGTRIIWTVHNLESHELRHPRLERWLKGHVVRRLDGFISLSRAGLGLVRDQWPMLRSTPGFVIPHGHYRDAYLQTCTKAQARQRLGVPSGAKVVAFVGRVRPYKNVETLVGEFRRARVPGGVLLVAGVPHNGTMRRRIEATAAGAAEVKLHWGRIPNQRLQEYFAAADLIVLPFADVLNSGSALLALSFNRPVLLPAVGSLPELAGAVGSTWVRTYPGALEASTLIEALEWASEERAATAPLEMFDWTRIAEDTLKAYQTLCRPRTRNGRISPTRAVDA